MNIVNLMRIPVILILIFSMISCSQKFELKEGDFLFQDLDCGPMCDAIEEVTQGIDGARLSHVGMVIIENDSFKVVEAVSAGVILTPLNEFINRSYDINGNPKIIIGRFKQEYQQLIPKAIEHLDSYLGASYNHSFIMGNNNYYCSQLLYLIFRSAHEGNEVFELAPMTFKQPEKDTFYPVWKNYYSKMGIEIPEGKPGINPGGMSRSPYIEIIHALGKPDGWKK